MILWTHMTARLLVYDVSEYYNASLGSNFVKQLIARRLMFNSCATEDHKMSALYIPLVT
jgi:hypothetical protein